MVQAFPIPPALHVVNARSTQNWSEGLDPAFLAVQIPDPDDERLSEPEFWQQVETAWQVCDRFDLQTDICRGRVLRVVRDREKRGGDGRGTGFLNWLKEREISKSQAYALIELANSADTLFESGVLEPETVNRFSKRAFVETAQAAPEVQQMVSDLIKENDQQTGLPPRITRRAVQQLNDEWTTMGSDLLPVEIKEKAANNTIPLRYLTPLVKEMEKLPETHQTALQAEVSANPDLDTVKQATAEARYLAKYLAAATQVQTLNKAPFDLELALEEALRIGCLSNVAEMVNSAAQLEQTVTRLYTTWRRLNQLSERVYVDSGASTPHLRSLLNYLSPLTSALLEVDFGDPNSSFARQIRVQVLSDDLEDWTEPEP
jgi:hypothetical protein